MKNWIFLPLAILIIVVSFIVGGDSSGSDRQYSLAMAVHGRGSSIPIAGSYTYDLSSTPTQRSQAPVPASISTQLISRNYQWSYRDRTWTCQLQIPQELYDYYKALPRSPSKNYKYSVYVTSPHDDSFIKSIADKIRKASQQEGYDEYEMVSLAAAFVQSLPYTTDLVTTSYGEYPRYPIETLVDIGGDCEDASILMASLLDALGCGAVLLIFPGSNGASGHCAVGVKGGEGIHGTYWEYDGQKYFYLETTSPAWKIGEMPPKYEYASANIRPLIPVP
jgi:hypothetical protein